ncbi:hypothetical protein JKP88DRAFT_335488 [Tribonema minus]|uniref:SAM domain-containing protein n=1 Tax=Tribonema minus TaxID=303371 RepID=A0A835YK16_9STRA|nr:hypothetical protein JKP88DRAFT_335488 [Tribonema minus]
MCQQMATAGQVQLGTKRRALPDQPTEDLRLQQNAWEAAADGHRHPLKAARDELFARQSALDPFWKPAATGSAGNCDKWVGKPGVPVPPGKVRWGPDARVKATLIALRPLLDLVEQPHKELIINERLLERAIAERLYATVQYLIDELGVDTGVLITDWKGRAATCVDFAVTYEMASHWRRSCADETVPPAPRAATQQHSAQRAPPASAVTPAAAAADAGQQLQAGAPAARAAAPVAAAAANGAAATAAARRSGLGKGRANKRLSDSAAAEDGGRGGGGGGGSVAPPHDEASLRAWVAHALGVAPHNEGACSIARRLAEQDMVTPATLKLLSGDQLKAIGITGVPARLIMSAVEQLRARALLQPQPVLPNAVASAFKDQEPFRALARFWLELPADSNTASVATLSKSLDLVFSNEIDLVWKLLAQVTEEDPQQAGIETVGLKMLWSAKVLEAKQAGGTQGVNGGRAVQARMRGRRRVLRRPQQSVFGWARHD